MDRDRDRDRDRESGKTTKMWRIWLRCCFLGEIMSLFGGYIVWIGGGMEHWSFPYFGIGIAAFFLLSFPALCAVGDELW